MTLGHLAKPSVTIATIKIEILLETIYNSEATFNTYEGKYVPNDMFEMQTLSEL